jgi:hypothetical protein
MDARPEDWPRFAPLGLIPIALAAVLAALVVIATAAEHSTAAGMAAAVGAVAGLVGAGWTIAAIRQAHRHGTWTPVAQARALFISLGVSIVVVPVALLARGAVQLVAMAVLAGGVFALTTGSLLWRRSVLRAHRRGR